MNKGSRVWLNSTSPTAPTGDALVSAAAAAHFGPLDVVVNNAGYTISGVVEGTPEPSSCSTSAPRGRILNLSSAGGFMSNPITVRYSATKFQKELNSARNVRITVVQLGGVRTRWAGANMHELPPPPACAGPDSVPTKYLVLIRNAPFIGDPAKVAKALVTLADAEIPPAKIPLGFDARVVVQSKLTEVQRELDEDQWWVCMRTV
ncbi:hypothetical protein BD413DRAFT_669995 [Trametes elegans]|nr:hypothetical protein BD413DRAFT_669995 [Trametes elegans]